MILIVRPLISPPTEKARVRLWVGLFGIAKPAQPTFFLGTTSRPPPQTPATPADGEQLYPIRDNVVDGHENPLNHQGVFTFPKLGPGLNHCFRVVAGGADQCFEFTSLPDEIPRSGAPLNILLSSCYYRPNDKNKILGDTISRLPQPCRPDLTLLAGDQVYLDVPVVGSWRFSLESIQTMIGQKYFENWCSQSLNLAGLQTVLARTPTACIPDDHEFWNNYPLRQAQLLPEWLIDKDGWSDVAMRLYQDFQLGGRTPNVRDMPGFQRIDVDPLSILMLDTRSRRDDEFERLMPDDAVAAIETWASELIAAKATPSPKLGILSAGQPLFTDPPGFIGQRVVDGDLANYTQFSLIEAQLERVVSQGIPVVFLTGDVHWSRVCAARYGSFQTPMLYEVICSPSTMIPPSPGDKLVDSVRGKDWPGFPTAPMDIPSKFGKNNHFKVSKRGEDDYFECNGNQVSVLQFRRAGFGVDMTVNYFEVSTDPQRQRRKTTQAYKLRFY